MTDKHTYTDPYLAKAQKRYEKKINRTPGQGPQGDCWQWAGTTDGRGYGEIKVRGRLVKAHRIALFGFENVRNPLLACHRCDNPLCVRPEHLFPGTSRDNVLDMRAKGRAHNYRKLTPTDVRHIRTSLETGCALARQYGVDAMTISRIRNGKIYTEPEYLTGAG